FGAGIITALMMTLLLETAEQGGLGRVMAIVSRPMIFGHMYGPVTGGFIVQVASWQWILLRNVIIVLMATRLIMKHIPEFEQINKESNLDVLGIISLSLMSVTLIYGITKAADHASFYNDQTQRWMVIGLIFAVIYFIYDRTRKNQTV